VLDARLAEQQPGAGAPALLCQDLGSLLVGAVASETADQPDVSSAVQVPSLPDGPS
jgi:hypothetical protein